MKWTSPQTVSAMILLLSGVILCYIAFIMSDANDVPEGALWYFGQTLIYAGGIFGIKLYADGKFIRFKKDIENKIESHAENA